MYLKKFVGDTTFNFPAAQSTVEQRWRFARDSVAMVGTIGTFPLLGDDNPVQELSVSTTLQFAWEQTVNGTLIDSWVDMVNVIQACITALMSGQGQLYAVREDGHEVWAWAKVTDLRRPSLANRRRLVELPVTFIVEDTWYDDALAGAWYFDDGHDFDAGLFFDATDLAFTAWSTAVTQLISNDGTAPARIMTITLTTNSGDVINPKLAVAENGMWCQWTGTVSTGTVVIAPGELSVTYSGSAAYTDLSIGTNQIEWLRFEPGDNNVTFTCSGGGSADITIEFYPPFWEA